MRKIIAMFEIDDEQAERYCKENGYDGVSPDELFESEMGSALTFTKNAPLESIVHRWNGLKTLVVYGKIEQSLRLKSP